ncbi:hypothetical protein H0H92_001925, partial [Tricholoma furcatifolium]
SFVDPYLTCQSVVNITPLGSNSVAGGSNNVVTTSLNFKDFDFSYWDTARFIPHDFSTPLPYHGMPLILPSPQNQAPPDDNIMNSEDQEFDEYENSIRFLPPAAPSSSPAPTSPPPQGIAP